MYDTAKGANVGDPYPVINNRRPVTEWLSVPHAGGPPPVHTILISLGFFSQGDLILRIEPVETELIFDFALKVQLRDSFSRLLSSRD